MNAKEAIRTSLQQSQNLVESVLADLSDADLLVRPVPGSNHIAWQMGHLITSEIGIGKNVPGAKYPELPAGWQEGYTRDTAAPEPPRGFATRAEYLAQFKKIRQATLDAAARLADTDLDKPVTGNIGRLAPTVGALLLFLSTHTMMHMGQFSVVRRKLSKPVLF